MRKILLLDICGTITKKNTTIDFIQSLGKDLHWSKVLYGRILWRLFKNDYLRRQYIKMLAGYSQDELSDLAEKYIENLELDDTILKYVSYLNSANFHLIFISATLDNITSALSKKFNANGIISSKLEYENSICTGKLSRDVLDMKEKHIESDIINPKNLTCLITDNYGDYALSKKCTITFAVSRSKKSDMYWLNKEVNLIKRHS
ncbi:haloacid dehalogenase-like hydrolase [Providencia zhijiangensis]|uniref:Haloacid dehalogenase-like hydrolase n=1 Tax=Providencia zhijiangensis TaxID=3053982 RepID=A0ABZ0N163_9GAMM|nr:haloacid dehalogenase-like hydrolase [Providencia sp. D4759]WPA92124.1 haloacid dehalogenase-like hydrolase [Providencia sp. D4759]